MRAPRRRRIQARMAIRWTCLTTFPISNSAVQIVHKRRCQAQTPLHANSSILHTHARHRQQQQADPWALLSQPRKKYCPTAAPTRVVPAPATSQIKTCLRQQQPLPNVSMKKCHPTSICPPPKPRPDPFPQQCREPARPTWAYPTAKSTKWTTPHTE